MTCNCTRVGPSLFLSLGGRVFRVNTYGREFLIEMHPLAGPTLVDADFNVIDTARKPKGFWQAADAINAMTPFRRQMIEVGEGNPSP